MTALAIMQLFAGGRSIERDRCVCMARCSTRWVRRNCKAYAGRDIGMVFQEPMTALNPLMRIGDQVAETVSTAR